jgi:hypothetical protein
MFSDKSALNFASRSARETIGDEHFLGHFELGQFGATEGLDVLFGSVQRGVFEHHCAEHVLAVLGIRNREANRIRNVWAFLSQSINIVGNNFRKLIIYVGL